MLSIGLHAPGVIAAGRPEVERIGAQERAVLELIVANPFAGQQEIATALGLARSTVAAHVVQLVSKGYILGRGYVMPPPRRIVCLGGAVLDRKYRALGPLVGKTSNPVEGYRSFGGAARNVAETLLRLGVSVGFLSAVGQDETGRALLDHLRGLGADVTGVLSVPDAATAEYAAILTETGSLALGIADMGVFDRITPDYLGRIWPHLASASWVLVDCNIPAEVLGLLIARKPSGRFRLAVDTVSAPKALRLPEDLTGIDLVFARLDEARALADRSGQRRRPGLKRAAAELRAMGAGAAVVANGAQDHAVATERGVTTGGAVAAAPVDMTGAGAALIAGTLAGVLEGATPEEAASTGALLAALTTECRSSVHPELSPALLESCRQRLPA